MVKNPPANAGDTSSAPDPGRFHISRETRLSATAIGATAVGSPRTAAAEGTPLAAAGEGTPLAAAGEETPLTATGESPCMVAKTWGTQK